MKRFKLVDYVLFSAAVAGGVLDEIRLMGGLVPSLYKARYGFVPSNYKKGSHYSTVSRMISIGNIKREVDSGGKLYLVLTSKGKQRIKQKFPLHFSKRKKWNDHFMMVVFDIKEEKRSVRDELRRKLVELGFGMMQKSVWISPYHFEKLMRSFLVRKHLDDCVVVFCAKKLWTGDIREFSSKVWKLEALNKVYKKIIKRVNIIEKFEGKEKIQEINALFSLYFRTLIKDPLLPGKMLPTDWSREEAVGQLNEILKNSNES